MNPMSEQSVVGRPGHLKPHPLVSLADLHFMDQKLASLQGWLFRPAALLTLALIRAQAGFSPRSAIVEIGVFEGRYLALLRYAIGQSDVHAVGIDTFQWIDRSAVHQALAGVLGPQHDLDLWSVDSQALQASDVADRVNGRPLMFASIDGDHAAQSVIHDLSVVDGCLDSNGVIAVDDFLNPLALGVTEGAVSYFARSQAGVVPFAYCGNKLFLCRPHRQDYYRDVTRTLVRESELLSEMSATRELWRLGDAYVDQRIFGSRCLVLSRGIDWDHDGRV